MPGYDGSGPMGAGPMTGGGRGMCSPAGRSYAMGGFGLRRGAGAGFGPQRGYGRGFGRRGAYPLAGGWVDPAFNAPYGASYVMKPEEELSVLRNEAGYVQEELDAINKRIETLETKHSE